MRLRITALWLALALLLTGCGSLNITSAPAPTIVGSDGEGAAVLRDSMPNCTANPELAQQLRAAIEAQQDTTVQGWAAETITACLDELLEAPELFWCTGYNLTAVTGLRTRADITFHWLYDDGRARYDAMCAAADAVLADAPAGDYETALYLYDWLEDTVTYAASEGYDQTAYAAICEGRAVCGGIADAYTFLLRRTGLQACTVTGTAAQDGRTESHAWNYAVLDGAVYGFDLTWDNSDRFDAAGREYRMHEWFAVTAADLAGTHTSDDARGEISAVANADNYYIREGYLLTDDSMDSVLSIWRPQAETGGNTLTFRCADDAVYQAVCFRLFELGEAAGLLRRLGLAGSDAFTVTYTMQDALCTVTVYLSPAA